MKNPCNGCDKRTAVCHIPGNCKQTPTYEEWRAEVTAAKAENRKGNESLAVIIGGIRKFKRQVHRHGKH